MRRQAPIRPRAIQSHFRLPFGSGSGPASDIRHSGAVGGTADRSEERWGTVSLLGDPTPDGALDGGGAGVGAAGAGASGSDATKELPHWAQNRLPSAFSVPQREHLITLSLHAVSCSGSTMNVIGF